MSSPRPPREELLEHLQHVLQETNPQRPLDSIEIVTVKACLARLGLDSEAEAPYPSTIAEWVQWAEHSSKAS